MPLTATRSAQGADQPNMCSIHRNDRRKTAARFHPTLRPETQRGRAEGDQKHRAAKKQAQSEEAAASRL
jgi:hypothetical protein